MFRSLKSGAFALLATLTVTLQAQSSLGLPATDAIRADEAALQVDKQLRAAFGEDYQETFRLHHAQLRDQAGLQARFEDDWMKWIEIMMKWGAILLPSARLDYTSHAFDPGRSGEGAAIDLSGRIYFPNGARDEKTEKEAMPLVVYCHGTELLRHEVASECRGVETGLMAALSCLSRTAIAIPDYEGMGRDEDHFHPYCQRESLAYSVLDCIPGAIQKLSECKGASWNGEVYLVGYSEGGYSAMAALKELYTNPRYEHLRAIVKGAAPMAGPFDLSGTMRDVMVGPDKHPNPFFLSYVIYGYREVYGNSFAPGYVIAPQLLEKRDGKNLTTLMNGRWSGDEVNTFIRTRLNLRPGEPVLPSETLNSQWLHDELTAAAYPATPTGRTLMANDLVRNRFHAAPWTPGPNVSLFFFHSLHDDNVAPANSQWAVQSWPQARTCAVLPDEWFGQKLDHGQGGMVGIPMAFLWIKAGMPLSH